MIYSAIIQYSYYNHTIKSQIAKFLSWYIWCQWALINGRKACSFFIFDNVFYEWPVIIRQWRANELWIKLDMIISTACDLTKPNCNENSIKKIIETYLRCVCASLKQSLFRAFLRSGVGKRTGIGLGKVWNLFGFPLVSHC